MLAVRYELEQKTGAGDVFVYSGYSGDLLHTEYGTEGRHLQ